MCFHRCSLPAGFQHAWLLQRMTNTFCSPSYACLEFLPGHPVTLTGDSCPHSHFPIFSSFCYWLGWLLAAISREGKRPLLLTSSQIRVPPRPCLSVDGSPWFLHIVGWVSRVVLDGTGLLRGLLTSLEMKGIQDTFFRHLLCPSWMDAGHSGMSQPLCQALGVRTPGLNPDPATF